MITAGNAAAEPNEGHVLVQGLGVRRIGCHPPVEVAVGSNNRVCIPREARPRGEHLASLDVHLEHRRRGDVDRRRLVLPEKGAVGCVEAGIVIARTFSGPSDSRGNCIFRHTLDSLKLKQFHHNAHRTIFIHFFLFVYVHVFFC